MSKKFTLKELAELTGSTVKGDDNLVITGVADLETATSSDASFLANPRYLKALKASEAGVVFISPDQEVEGARAYLLNSDPSRAFQQALEAFHGDRIKHTGFTGIHDKAVVHPTATVGKNVILAPNVTIDEGVTIGNGTTILPGTYIGPHSKIGCNCTIHANVTIREQTHIGDRVIIQPGAVIGSCGFGLTTDATGAHTKLNQIGNVVIEDDVEVGANTTIDRARFKSTTIKAGAKIDNLVQVGHNVTVGRHSILVAQSGIAGSSELGDGVILASQAGVTGHVKVASRTVLTARTGVTKTITKPGVYGGNPATDLTTHNKRSVYLRNIETYVKDLTEIKKQLKTLKESLNQ